MFILAQGNKQQCCVGMCVMRRSRRDRLRGGERVGAVSRLRIGVHIRIGVLGAGRHALRRA